MKKYNGVIVPMVTPVTSDRKLDETAVVKIADSLYCLLNLTMLMTPPHKANKVG